MNEAARTPESWEPENGEVESMEEEIQREPDARSSRNGAPPPKPRPQVVVTEDVQALVTVAIAGVLENASIGLYQRGRSCVRVIRDKARKVPGLTVEHSARFRKHDPPAIVAADIDYLREAVDRSVEFVKVNKEGETRKVLPPNWVLLGILARGAWPFPRLESVSECPLMRPDGSILQVAGFDEASGILYEPPSCAFATVTASPTKGDAEDALAVVAELFRDFPFVAPEDRSAAIAAFLSVVGRHAIPGSVPLFAVRATTPGSGKTLLVDAVATVVTGRKAPPFPPTREPEEERKRVMAIAREGTPIVLIDNASGSFGSDVLAAVLTSETITDRLMGSQEQITAPMRCVWFVTGNNLGFRGDLGRRVLPIDLDPGCEHPEEERTAFAHGQDEDYLAWCAAERGRVVPAALTILRAFVVAGKPRDPSIAKLGRYSGWDDLVRGSLLWIGVADPLKTRDRVKESDDLELDSLRMLLRAWRDSLGDRDVTAAKLVFESASNERLHAAIAEVCPTRKERVSPKELGYALTRNRGRIVDGMRLVRTKSGDAGNQWKVVTDGQ